MADSQDIVTEGKVNAPDLGQAFPTISSQAQSAPPQRHSLFDFSGHDDTVKEKNLPGKDGKREYGIVGGLTHVPGDSYLDLNSNHKNYSDHQEYIAIQTFFSPHLSTVLGSNLHNIYGDDSLAFSGCAETSRLANTVSFGACAGIEYGMKDHVHPDLLISGENFVPKGELYMILGNENIKPELKLGVETFPTPQGDYKPAYTLQVRFPLP